MIFLLCATAGAMLRPRESQVFSQSASLVLGVKHAAAVQLGHDLIEKIVKPTREVRRHDIEAVTCAIMKPVLHLIRDACGLTAQLQMPSSARHCKVKLPDGQIVLPRQPQ